MLDSTLKGFYEELKPKADKSRRYSKVTLILMISFLIMYLVLSTLNPLIAVFLNLDSFVSFIAWAVSFVILLVLTIRVLEGKLRKYNLTVDEWSIFLACSILKNLEGYSKASKNENHEAEKEYKKMAVQDARAFLSTVEKGWEIGDLKLVKSIFKGTISKFRKNLQTKLIPNLERLDMERFEKVESTVYNIAHVVLKSDLPTLNNLNDSTFLQLDEYPSSKEKLLSRWSNYLQGHRILQHILALTVIGILAFSSFLVLWYEGASIDTTYSTPFIVFSALAAGYITIAFIKRESPKTSESK